MVEIETEKMLRVMVADGKIIATESIEGSSPTRKEYDSDIDGDLFLYKMGEALDGIKEALPEINFRRKHPKLGKKIANLEQRVRRIEKTIKSFKNLLAPHLLNGMKKDAVDYIDRYKDDLIDSL